MAASAGGNRTPLDPQTLTYSWGAWTNTPKDITRFRSVFQPDQGIFSPGYPLEPIESRPPRAWDYPVGYNTRFTPRSGEAISFKELRALAENHNITRLCIETRKDQIEGQNWSIRARDENNVSPNAEKRAAQLTEFWSYPDGRTPFASWIRKLVEEVLVTDAAAIEPRYNRGGKIIALDPIDGSTIKVLLDETGRTPQSPAPAFEQIIHGKPWVLLEDGSRVNTAERGKPLTDRHLIYAPRNPRVHGAYGYSPVEQIVLTVNTGLRRELQQLQYFTESNVPLGLANTPPGWNTEQIAQYQAWFDSLLAGNTGNRSRLIWGPEGAKYTPFLDAPVKDKFDEWLSRIVCFAFSLPPNAFVERINRATAQTAQEAALEEGLGPLLAWAKRLIDGIIQNRMGHTDLEFSWDQNREIDPAVQAKIATELVGSCLKTLNEARDDLGLDPIDGGDEPMFITASGPILLRNLLAANASQEASHPPGSEPSGEDAGVGGSPGEETAPAEAQAA